MNAALISFTIVLACAFIGSIFLLLELRKHRKSLDQILENTKPTTKTTANTKEIARENVKQKSSLRHNNKEQ